MALAPSPAALLTFYRLLALRSGGAGSLIALCPVMCCPPASRRKLATCLPHLHPSFHVAGFDRACEEVEFAPVSMLPSCVI